MAGVNPERLRIARKRLQSVLRTHGIATARTLENKISDAGPTNQRIDPHILTIARDELQNVNVIETYREHENATPWYYLRGTPHQTLDARFLELNAVYRETQDGQLKLRTGQALEIAVSKALQSQTNFNSIGHFRDLGAHGDDRLYSKEEPPSLINGRTCRGKLDFILFDKDAGAVGVEVKNIREWFYSDRDEVKEFLAKCCALDAVPVLIVRRYAYEAFSVLTDCGVLVHQMYNQRYANADRALAERVKDKRLLGYHDVRVGNDADERLIKFVHANLPMLLARARGKFNDKKELLEAYAHEGRDGIWGVCGTVRGRASEGPVFSSICSSLVFVCAASQREMRSVGRVGGG